MHYVTPPSKRPSKTCSCASIRTSAPDELGEEAACGDGGHDIEGCPGSSGPNTFLKLWKVLRSSLWGFIVLKQRVIINVLCIKESLFARRWWSSHKRLNHRPSLETNDFSSNLIIAGAQHYRNVKINCIEIEKEIPSKHKPKGTWWTKGFVKIHLYSQYSTNGINQVSFG